MLRLLASAVLTAGRRIRLGGNLVEQDYRVQLTKFSLASESYALPVALAMKRDTSSENCLVETSEF